MLKPDVPVNYKSLTLAGAGEAEFPSLTLSTYPGISYRASTLGPETARPLVSPGSSEEFLFLPLVIVDNSFWPKLNDFNYLPTQEKVWILDSSFNDLNMSALTETHYQLERGLYYFVRRMPPSTQNKTPYPRVVCIPPTILGMNAPWAPVSWGIDSPTMTPLAPLISGGQFYCSTSHISPIKGERVVSTVLGNYDLTKMLSIAIDGRN